MQSFTSDTNEDQGTLTLVTLLALKSIAADEGQIRHRFGGHAIGLDHPDDTDALMSYRYDEHVQALRPSDIAAASDPNGSVTLFEAIEKQLGLKLEATKRPVPVFVIDHAEQKPTEN